MASLTVLEYQFIPRDLNHQRMPTPLEETGKTVKTVVSVGGGSLQSNLFNSETRFVFLVSDTDCWINVGENPTAATETAGSQFLAAGVHWCFGLPEGSADSYRVAVIAA